MNFNNLREQVREFLDQLAVQWLAALFINLDEVRRLLRRLRMTHTYQETQLIEPLLARAGWAVQSLGDPARTEGRSVAIRDHPPGRPLPLYLLVIDVRVVGVVYAEQAIVGRRIDCEWAKRADGVLMPAGLTRVRARLPFTYYSTGSATDFLNCLEEAAQPHRVAGFHRPEMLARWLEQAPEDLASEGVSERAGM